MQTDLLSQKLLAEVHPGVGSKPRLVLVKAEDTGVRLREYTHPVSPAPAGSQ